MAAERAHHGPGHWVRCAASLYSCFSNCQDCAAAGAGSSASVACRYLPHAGIATIIMNDYPIAKYALIGEPSAARLETQPFWAFEVNETHRAQGVWGFLSSRPKTRANDPLQGFRRKPACLVPKCCVPPDCAADQTPDVWQCSCLQLCAEVQARHVTCTFRQAKSILTMSSALSRVSVQHLPYEQCKVLQCSGSICPLCSSMQPMRGHRQL